MKNFLIVLSLFFYAFCDAQDYQQYFLNKVVVDSLVRLGRYQDAVQNMRKCIGVPEMATMTDEFYIGYAYFKMENIDSAALFLNKALKEGFYFQEMAYVDHWREKGVFDKFKKHKTLETVPGLLIKNTIDYLREEPIDSMLAKELIVARKLDQQHRTGKASDSLWAKQMILDKQNQEFLKKVIQGYGWPGKKLVGYEGSNSTFLIAQHADMDTVFQNVCLKYIQKAFHQHDVNSADYAYIIDRVRVNSNRAQLFGTQFYAIQESGKMKLKLKPVEGEMYLNLRRKIFGLPPVDQYLSSSQERINK